VVGLYVFCTGGLNSISTESSIFNISIGKGLPFKEGWMVRWLDGQMARWLDGYMARWLDG
jgi:hypothetical protein